MYQRTKPILKDEIKHNAMYQPTALEIYRDVLRHKLDRDVEVRPDGLVIKLDLFWLVAVPSCLISDKNIQEQFNFSHQFS